MSLYVLGSEPVAPRPAQTPARPTGTPEPPRTGLAPVVTDGEALRGLVCAARDGDAEAFGDLYAHHRASVHRLLVAKTRSTALADDLTSETFCRAWAAMSQFRLDEQYFGAWLRRIARNLATDHFRSQARGRELTTADMGLLETDAVAGPDEVLLAAVHSEELTVSMLVLPADQRRCIMLRYIDGFSIAETAAILGRSEGAVKQLQWRGLRNLAKSFPRARP